MSTLRPCMRLASPSVSVELPVAMWFSTIHACASRIATKTQRITIIFSRQRGVGAAQRQRHDEPRAAGRGTLGREREVAAVLDRDLAGDREAEPGAGRLRRHVRLEDLFAIRVGYALA